MKLVILAIALTSSLLASAGSKCATAKQIRSTAEIAEFLKDISLSGNKTTCLRLERQLENACTDADVKTLAIASEILEEDCR